MRRIAAWDEWVEAIGDPKRLLVIQLAAYQKVDQRFRTPPGRVIPEHLLYFVAEGSFPGTVRQSAIRLGAGTLFLLPPGVPHQFWVEAPAPVVLTLRFRLFEGGLHGSGAPTSDVAFGNEPLVWEEAWRTLSYLDSLYLECQEERPYRDVRTRDLLRLALTEAFRCGLDVGGDRRLSPAQRRRVVDFVRGRGDDLPSTKELARAVDLSDVYFSRLFRSTFGVAPRTWLKEERIRRGAHLLMETDLTVTEIADRLGYHDFHLFSRQFKQVMKSSPTDYRRRH